MGSKSALCSYIFKDSKTSNNVAEALLFVAKFSKREALVRLCDSSVGIIWSGSSKMYFIHAEVTALGMFRNRQQLRHDGLDNSTIILVNPTVLGKTLKGGSQDRNVSIYVIKPNIVRVNVEYKDTAKRTIVHSLPCETKTLEDYKSMLIGEIEQKVCHYDTKSLVNNVNCMRHIISTFVRLNTPRIYIWSRQFAGGNNLTINARTQGSSTQVNLTDLENGFTRQPNNAREEATVCIETRKLALFLSGILAQNRSKISFDIEHNKCLKITLDKEIMQGEKFYQSLLLLHSINN